nr:MAG TPA: hypothetical protein [Caudoviricetes sp.]
MNFFFSCAFSFESLYFVYPASAKAENQRREGYICTTISISNSVFMILLFRRLFIITNSLALKLQQVTLLSLLLCIAVF